MLKVKIKMKNKTTGNEYPALSEVINVEAHQLAGTMISNYICDVTSECYVLLLLSVANLVIDKIVSISSLRRTAQEMETV